MKQFVLKTIGVIGSVLLTLLVVGKFDNADKYMSKNENIVKLNCIAEYDSLEYIFVGGSYTYSGVKPEVFDSLNNKSFNFGVATAGPYFYELVINDYIKRANKKPKVVFLLVSSISFSSKCDNFVSYPLHRYLNTPISNERILCRYGVYDEYPKLVIKSFKNGLNNLWRKKRKPASPGLYQSMRDNKGFIPSDVQANVEIISETEHYYLGLKHESFNHAKAEYLIKLATSFEKENIAVIFYTLPTNLLDSYFNKEYLQEYHKYIAKMQTIFPLISVELPKDNFYFRNVDHLNSMGAEKATLQLLNGFRQYLVAKNRDINKLSLQ